MSTCYGQLKETRENTPLYRFFESCRLIQLLLETMKVIGPFSKKSTLVLDPDSKCLIVCTILFLEVLINGETRES